MAKHTVGKLIHVHGKHTVGKLIYVHGKRTVGKLIHVHGKTYSWQANPCTWQNIQLAS